jgi:hypothetical protein
MLRGFALAHALGMLDTRIGRRKPALFLGEIQLTGEHQRSSYPMLVEALDNFVVRLTDAAGGPIDKAAVLARIGAKLAATGTDALKEAASAPAARFAPYQDDCPPTVGADFVQLVSLFLALECEAREQVTREAGV